MDDEIPPAIKIPLMLYVYFDNIMSPAVLLLLSFGCACLPAKAGRTLVLL